MADTDLEQAPASPVTSEERLDQVKATWLADHHGRPVRLQRSDVGAIAIRLMEAGVQPTVENVRLVNGGKGSPNTIHPALRGWYESRGWEKHWKRPPPPANLPAPFMRVWDEVLDVARQTMRVESLAEHKKARETLERERAELADQAQALAERERDVATRIEAQQVLIKRLEHEAADARRAQERAEKKQAAEQERATAKLQQAHDELAALRARLAEAERAMRQQQQQIERSAAQAQEQTTALDAARVALDAVREERDRARAAAADFEAANRAVIAARDVAERQLQSLNAYLASQAEAHASELARRNTEHASELEVLRSELNGMRDAASRLAATLEAREKAVEQAASARDAAAAERDRLQGILTAREQRITELEAEVRAARERTRENP